MKGAIFVSDERMKYTYQLLLELGYELDYADTAQMGRRLVQNNPKLYDFIIAPIRGVIDGTMSIKGESFEVHEFLSGLKENVPIITGFVSEYLKDKKFHTISFQEDKEFRNENGKLTAQGILKMIIEKTPKSIYSYRYDILGAGMAGLNIKEILEKLGLTVRITTHAEIEQWKMKSPYEVIINATPVSIYQLLPLEEQKEEITIIDISSMRLEVDEFIKEKNIHYYPAPPLPGTVAPQTAGELLGMFIDKILQ